MPSSIHNPSKTFPSPQPSPGGRGGRPRCLASSADMKLPCRLWLHSKTCRSVQLLNIPESVSSPGGRGGRPRCLASSADMKLPCRLWLHSKTCRSVQLLNIPESVSSPGGRGGRPRCLASSADMKLPCRLWLHSKTCRSVQLLNIPNRFPLPWEREPTEVSCIIRRHEIAVSIMASQQDVQVGAALEYPRIGSLSLRRGGRPRCLASPADMKLPCRLWIHSKTCRSVQLLNIPESVPSPLGEG